MLHEGNYRDQYASRWKAWQRLRPWLVLLFCRVLQPSAAESEPALSALLIIGKMQILKFLFFRAKRCLCTCALHRYWNNCVKHLSFWLVLTLPWRPWVRRQYLSGFYISYKYYEELGNNPHCIPCDLHSTSKWYHLKQAVPFFFFFFFSFFFNLAKEQYIKQDLSGMNSCFASQKAIYRPFHLNLLMCCLM